MSENRRILLESLTNQDNRLMKHEEEILSALTKIGLERKKLREMIEKMEKEEEP